MKKSIQYDRVADTTPTFRRIGSSEVEDGLGATASNDTPGRSGSPYSIAALGRALAGQLASTGGRPSRTLATTVKKVPLTRVESNALREITELVRRQGVSATPGQIAGILLNQSMTDVLAALVRPPAEGQAVADVPRVRPASNLAQLEHDLERVLAAAASAEAQLERLRPVAEELLAKMRSGKGLESER